MNYQTYTLPNGLTLIHKPDKRAVAYCGLVINAGSRDELEDEYGMAHFVEHMLFKGTQKRRSAHIITRLENVGGDLNAFTSKEETVVYATVLTEYIERAIELIADISLHSTFPQKEIDKEVEVILDEIDSYNDSPSELIYDDFEDLLFENHALGHLILGVPELLKKYTTADFNRFISRLYRPEQMVFFLSGDVPFKTLIRWAEKYFIYNCGFTEAVPRINPVQYTPATKVIGKNTHQVHVVIGNRAYDMHDKDRMAMYFLNNILGGPGMSSLLNLSLREKYGLVYNVESTYQAFSDSGEWCVYFACDTDSAKKCESLVYKELEKLRENKLSDSALKKYKLQLYGQLAISSENKENMALSMGKSYLRYGKVDSIEEIRNKIDQINASDLQRVANEIFVPEQLTVLKYHP